MRVILKPGGLLMLAAAIGGLSILDFTRSSLQPTAATARTLPSSGAPAPTAKPSADPARPGGGMEITATDDSYVAAADFANDPRKSLDYILIKTPASDDKKHNRIGYLKVPLDQISGTHIKSARLVFHLNRLAAGARTAQLNPDGTLALTISGLSDTSWSSDKLTWNTQPGPKAVSRIGVLKLKDVGWYTFDVTDYVNARLSSNHVAAFRLSDDKKADTVISIEGSRAAVNKPYLLITQ